MREILFRGKTQKGIWIEGFYCPCCFGYFPCRPAIIDKNEMDSGCWKPEEVIPETVSQYTGLTDKNGTKIFEGDIVKNDWCFLRGYSVIKFGQYKPLDMSNDYQQGHLGFYLEHIHEVDKKTTRKDIMYFANKCEVIGNIHDNPELLGGEQR